MPQLCPCNCSQLCMHARMTRCFLPGGPTSGPVCWARFYFLARLRDVRSFSSRVCRELECSPCAFAEREGPFLARDLIFLARRRYGDTLLPLYRGLPGIIPHPSFSRCRPSCSHFIVVLPALSLTLLFCVVGHLAPTLLWCFQRHSRGWPSN